MILDIFDVFLPKNQGTSVYPNSGILIRGTPRKDPTEESLSADPLERTPEIRNFRLAVWKAESGHQSAQQPPAAAWDWILKLFTSG